jgi:hypothetical protein
VHKDAGAYGEPIVLSLSKLGQNALQQMLGKLEEIAAQLER